MNNTEDLTMRIVNPGAEVMAIYGSYLTGAKSRMIHIAQRQASTNVVIKMSANVEEWMLSNRLSSKWNGIA